MTTAALIAKTFAGGLLYGSTIGYFHGSVLMKSDPKKSISVGIVLTTIAIAAANFCGRKAFLLTTFFCYAGTIAYKMGFFEKTPLQKLFFEKLGL